mgnify:CR=1 FL=1
MQTSNKWTALQVRIAIAILSLNALALSKNVISLIIADLIQTYPEYPVSTIQLIFSTTTGMAVVGSLLCIWLEKRMTLKSMSMLTLVSILIGGALGLVFAKTSVPMLFLSSILIGIGMGLITPLNGINIANHFEGADLVKMNAQNSVAATVGSVVFPLIGGLLVVIDWPCVYWIFFLSIPVMIITIIVQPREELQRAPRVEGGAPAKVKVWSPALICWVIESFFAGLCWMVYQSNASSLFQGLGFENYAQMASYGSFLFAGMNVIAATTLKFFCRKFGKPCMTGGIVLMAIGLFMLAACSSTAMLWLIFVATAIIGFGFGIFKSASFVFLPITLDKGAAAKGFSYFNAANVLGNFLTPYLITSTVTQMGGTIYTRYILSAVICAGLSVFAIATQKLKGTEKIAG